MIYSWLCPLLVYPVVNLVSSLFPLDLVWPIPETFLSWFSPFQDLRLMPTSGPLSLLIQGDLMKAPLCSPSHPRPLQFIIHSSVRQSFLKPSSDQAISCSSTLPAPHHILERACRLLSMPQGHSQQLQLAFLVSAQAVTPPKWYVPSSNWTWHSQAPNMQIHPSGPLLTQFPLFKRPTTACLSSHLLW